MVRPVIVKGLKIGQGKVKICVPFTGKDRGELERFADNIRRGRVPSAACFDMIEWRADKFKGLSDPEMLAEAAALFRTFFADKPLIFTVRTNKELEDFEISDENYIKINQYAADHGLADLIDIEFSRIGDGADACPWAAYIHAAGRKMICSSHRRSHTPDRGEILDTLFAMEETGADILKYAAMPVSGRDVLTLMDAAMAYGEEGGRLPLIAMSMGETGCLSRICGSLTGSCVTFGTAGCSSAPGQLPADRLREILDITGMQP